MHWGSEPASSEADAALIDCIFLVLVCWLSRDTKERCAYFIQGRAWSGRILVLLSSLSH